MSKFLTCDRCGLADSMVEHLAGDWNAHDEPNDCIAMLQHALAEKEEELRRAEKLLSECAEELEENVEFEGRLSTFVSLAKRIRNWLAGRADVPQPLRTQLYDLAAQENCDGEPWDTIQRAADYIGSLEEILACEPRYELVGYVLAMHGGNGPIVGAWRDRHHAEQLLERQPAPHDDVIIPVYRLNEMDEGSR